MVRTAAASIIGGTASVLGGGKFVNGAVSGAFVHLFNAEMKSYIKSVSVNIDENIKKILWLKKHVGSGPAILHFYNNVKPHGAWDYKRIYGRAIGEDMGNFNYGATGAAAGFGMNTLLRAAGLVQEAVGAYSPDDGHFYGNYPYGDNHNDQQMIMEGFYYYKRKYN
jgi:hypothetical protein